MGGGSGVQPPCDTPKSAPDTETPPERPQIILTPPRWAPAAPQHQQQHPPHFIFPFWGEITPKRLKEHPPKPCARRIWANPPFQRAQRGPSPRIWGRCGCRTSPGAQLPINSVFQAINMIINIVINIMAKWQQIPPCAPEHVFLPKSLPSSQNTLPVGFCQPRGYRHGGRLA